MQFRCSTAYCKVSSFQLNDTSAFQIFPTELGSPLAPNDFPMTIYPPMGVRMFRDFSGILQNGDTWRLDAPVQAFLAILPLFATLILPFFLLGFFYCLYFSFFQ